MQSLKLIIVKREGVRFRIRGVSYLSGKVLYATAGDMPTLVTEEQTSFFKLSLGQGTSFRPVTVDESILQSILSDSTQRTQSLDKSIGIRKRGEVYTPTDLVRKMLDLVGYVPNTNLSDMRLVDPACGLGSFLKEAVTRLKMYYLNNGLNPSRKKDASHIMHGIETHIMGVEVSSTAIQRSVISYLEPLRDVIRTLGETDPSFVPHPSLYLHDALSPALVPTVPFDFIVGNPPYVRHRDLPKRIQENRSKDFHTATGRFDEYVLFFEIALRWLRVGGQIAFVTPDRFLTADYGLGLRRLLSSQTRIRWMLKLPERIFGGVGIYPIITVAEKSDEISSNRVNYVEINSTQELELLGRPAKAFDSRTVAVQQPLLGSNPWSFVPEWAAHFVRTLQRSYPPLGSVARTIFTGIATGANSVFILRGRLRDIEPDLLIPVLRGPDINKARISWSGHYLLNPYETSEGAPRPIDLGTYPNARRYLEEHKQLLKLKYHTQEARKEWYETHDTIDIRLQQRKKIVTPDIARSNRFAVDRGEFLCLNTCNVILYDETNKTEALAALLNSILSEFLFRLSSPRLGKGYLRYMKQYLGRLPVMDPATLPKNVSWYLASCYGDREWDSLNDYVFDLYGIPKTVRARIRRSVTTNR